MKILKNSLLALFVLVTLASCEKEDTPEQELNSINKIENLSTNSTDKASLNDCEIKLVDHPRLRIIDAQGARPLVQGLRETITWSVDGVPLSSIGLARSIVFPYASYLTESGTYEICFESESSCGVLQECIEFDFIK